jgi:hypothetical protein
MNYLWHFLTFAVGSIFGVIIMALMVASGDDRK